MRLSTTWLCERERIFSGSSFLSASNARFGRSDVFISARNSSDRIEISGVCFSAAARISTILVDNGLVDNLLNRKIAFFCCLSGPAAIHQRGADCLKECNIVPDNNLLRPDYIHQGRKGSKWTASGRT